MPSDCDHFERSEGLHGSQPEPDFSGDCVYCRDEDAVVCEGFCVHCGREVLWGRAELAGSATGTARLEPAFEDSHLGGRNVRRDSSRLPCRDGGTRTDLTYGESLSVAWALIWRGAIIAAAVSLVAGLFVWISGSNGRTAIQALGVTLIIPPLLLLGVFVIMPWLVRTIVKKRFRNFSLVVLREQEGIET